MEGLGSSPAQLQTIRTSRQELRTHKHTPFHQNSAGARPGELRTTLTTQAAYLSSDVTEYVTQLLFLTSVKNIVEYISSTLQDGRFDPLGQGCQTHFRLRARSKKMSPCAGRITLC